MSDEMMNTKQAADYLGIHEKQLYALIKAGRIPATRITGKWIFPRRLIDEWIESNAREGLGQARQKSRRISGALLAAGSNDPVLDILQTRLRRLHKDFLIFSANTGSTEGLLALGKGYTDIAWTHLLDPASGAYNIPYLDTLLPRIDAVVVNLFYRDVGLVMAPGNPKQIRGLEDIAKEGVTFINRQAGSGTRVLLDYHLDKLKISPASVFGYERELYTHLEVGLSVLSGRADTGISTIAVAKMLGLSFVHIKKESFDMVINRSIFFEKGIQAIINSLRSKDFLGAIEAMRDYDFEDSGKILYAKQ